MTFFLYNKVKLSFVETAIKKCKQMDGNDKPCHFGKCGPENQATATGATGRSDSGGSRSLAPEPVRWWGEPLCCSKSRPTSTPTENEICYCYPGYSGEACDTEISYPGNIYYLIII